MSLARVVSRDEALSYAGEALKTSVSSLEIVWTGFKPSDAPAFYAINSKNGGFVVISGTDCVNPVLAYSREGSFKATCLPPNLSAYFSVLEQDLRTVENKHIKVSNEDRGLWNVAPSSTKASYPSSFSVTTATWDQGNPYNMYCVFDGQKCVTGCVATAMAIIYRYHSHPAKGIGKSEAYVYNGLHIPAFDFSAESFDWKNMPLENAAVQKASDASKKAIGRLMLACGASVQMQYTPNSSGAFSEDVSIASIENFGYDPKTVRYLLKSVYTSKEWADILKTEISSGRPVCYGSQSSVGGGGHQFVIDGYDDKGYFRVNWGWGGSSNGYYTIELAVGNYRFCSDSDATNGIQPTQTPGTPTGTMMIMKDRGLCIDKGCVEKGSTFSLGLKYFCNWGPVDYNGQIRLALLDRSGAVKEALPAEDFSLQRDYMTSGTIDNCVVKSDIDISDRLVLQYKDMSSGEFVTARYNRQAHTCGFIIPTKYNFIITDESYNVGDVFDFDIASQGTAGTVKWFYDDKEIEKEYFITLTSAGTHKIKAEITTDAGTETIVQEVIVK